MGLGWNNLNGELHTAITAARAAGKIIVERYLERYQVTPKGYRDVVTEVDLAAEQAILEIICERYPAHAIVSEEAGGRLAQDGYVWVVDPLDGTTNFSRQVPICAVSIGLLKDGEPLLGVVYDPVRDQMFVAERGKGAMLNGAPIHVSQREAFLQTLVGLDWSHANEVRERLLVALKRIAPRCGTLRSLGSATLGFAYVAAGWLDAYFHAALQPWDAAAGILLVAEAGGQVSTITGTPYCIGMPDCLVTNGRIHATMLAYLNGSSSED